MTLENTLEQTIDVLANKYLGLKSEFTQGIRFGEAPDFSNMKSHEVVSKITACLRFLGIKVDGMQSYLPYEDEILKRIHPESVRKMAAGLYVRDHKRIVARIPREIIRATFSYPVCGKWLGPYVLAGMGDSVKGPSKSMSYSDYTLYGLIRLYGQNGMKSIRKKNKSSKFSIYLPHEKAVRKCLHAPKSKVQKHTDNSHVDFPQKVDHNEDHNGLVKKTLPYELRNIGSGHGGGHYTL
ncbi:MAG: hypothetical protein KKE23_01940 [Nanoarchaeota archaeon]|nr:hypothetical protein [Nanoarchaeota archaeon]